MNCFLKIDEIHPKMDGWATLEKAQTLASIVLAFRPKVSVEIGVYAGKSLIPIALAHKEVSGIVYGIDPWSVEAAQEGYDKENADWWGRKDNLDRVRMETFGWIESLNLGSHCKIIRKKSDDVTPFDCDLAHIDGQHSSVCIRDVTRFVLPMKVGSIVVMDDIGWTNNGVAHVSQAVDLMEKNGWVKLYNLETGAVFQRRY